MAYHETTVLYLPNAPFNVYSMEVCPTLPSDIAPVLQEDYAVRKNKGRNSYIIWYPGGSVVHIMPDKTIKVWYPKPTLNDAVHSLNTNTRKMFQFNSDGSVMCFINGIPYYWPASRNKNVEEGPFETGYYDNRRSQWVFESEECDCCECGSNREYERDYEDYA